LIETSAEDLFFVLGLKFGNEDDEDQHQVKLVK